MGLRNLCHDGQKAHADEKNSAWVLFPNGKEYLLPRYARRVKYRPVFGTSGTKLDSSHPDPVLAASMEKLFSHVDALRITESAQCFLILEDEFGPTEFFLNMLEALRVLIQTNYDYTDDQVADLLTLDAKGFEKLIEPVMRHLLEK